MLVRHEDTKDLETSKKKLEGLNSSTFWVLALRA